MRLVNCVAFLLVFLAVNCVSAADKSPAPLAILQEAYQAATNNLVSGSGTGSYEIYAAPSGKETRLELMLKAKTKVFFDHGKFHIRFDYEKDDIHRYDSRVIIYDGTDILVSRISKRIHPAGSEADIYEAKPTHQTLIQACFAYNPCQMLSGIVPSVDWLSDPKYASNLTFTQDANKDYSGSYIFTTAPHHLRATFLATQRSGYNINTYRVFLVDYNNHPFKTCRIEWDRKKNVWYVKSIDTQESPVGSSIERSVFNYTSFEPNVEVSPSLFKFEALSLSPEARVIDRRPNTEQLVLRQSPSSRSDVAKLDKLADTVKTLAPDTPKHRVSMISPTRSNKWRRYYLLGAGMFFSILGLLLLWKRIRARKGSTTPNP